MSVHKVESASPSVTTRASQLQALIQRDIFIDKDVSGKKSFIVYYLQHWGRLPGYDDMTRSYKELLTALPWKDWYDAW